MSLDSSYLNLLAVLIPTSILIAKIIFLAKIFYRYRIKTVLAYIFFLLLSSYPLSYLNSAFHNWIWQTVDSIKSNNISISWLGITQGDQVFNLLLLERLSFNIVNFIELLLFILLIRSLLRVNRHSS